jgi:hypothetical protein
MKLRIRGNSIRLRLSQGEVDRFARDGKVEESVKFAPAARSFTYAIESDDRRESVVAEYADDRLCVYVPGRLAKDWVESEQVGFGSPEGAVGPRIMVEKDFACLTPRAGEDESDMYPHPQNAVC